MLSPLEIARMFPKKICLMVGYATNKKSYLSVATLTELEELLGDALAAAKRRLLEVDNVFSYDVEKNI